MAQALSGERRQLMAKLGFIGLGIMGKPMAKNLLAARHTVHVCRHLNPEPVRELCGQGAVECSCCREIARKSDVIFIMVPDTPDVETVLFGKDGVAEGVRQGSIVVDMSSISPMATREFARKLKAVGVEMLDAPVSGGQVGAENAALSFMVGGRRKIFEQIKPYFEIMGKNIVHIGGNGAGQTCKVANQIVVALTIEAVAEALIFAANAGAEPGKVREALLGGFAQSRVLEVHGERMLQRNFKPGFRIKLHQKDLNLALQEARELGLSLPGTAIVQEMFNAVEANNHNLDHSALILALEMMAGGKLTK
jgi:2-hydroxy-3-oxopropionate reductase